MIIRAGNRYAYITIINNIDLIDAGKNILKCHKYVEHGIIFPQYVAKNYDPEPKIYVLIHSEW